MICGYFSSNLTVMTIHIFHIFTLYCTNQGTSGEPITTELCQVYQQTQSQLDDLHWRGAVLGVCVLFFGCLFFFFKRYLCWHFYYNEVHSTLTASATRGKRFAEMKLLLQQGCLWRCLIPKGARTRYIDRGWSVLYIQKRGITSVLPPDIDVRRGDKNKCIFFPVLKHAKTKCLLQVVCSSEY